MPPAATTTHAYAAIGRHTAVAEVHLQLVLEAAFAAEPATDDAVRGGSLSVAGWVQLAAGV